jgi:hypothetical protein
VPPRLLPSFPMPPTLSSSLILCQPNHSSLPSCLTSYYRAAPLLFPPAVPPRLLPPPVLTSCCATPPPPSSRSYILLCHTHPLFSSLSYRDIPLLFPPALPLRLLPPPVLTSCCAIPPPPFLHPAVPSRLLRSSLLLCHQPSRLPSCCAKPTLSSLPCPTSYCATNPLLFPPAVPNPLSLLFPVLPLTVLPLSSLSPLPYLTYLLPNLCSCFSVYLILPSSLSCRCRSGTLIRSWLSTRTSYPTRMHMLSLPCVQIA